MPSPSIPSTGSWRKPLTLLTGWKGQKKFLLAQAQVLVVLFIAHIGNTWPHNYHRNENHNENMFWVMNAILLIAALGTLKHNPEGSSRGVQLLSRPQTEEWKGWMQFAFIMYHYFRMFPIYNEIRVFVSSYVWMTGFGNYLYFNKTQDFSIERMISMWLRINYFPLLLSIFLGVKLELYYVVPLHTIGFFTTMATCYGAKFFRDNFAFDNTKSNLVAFAVALVLHVAFFETRAIDFLKLFGDDYPFRFQTDRYSAWFGMVSGFMWGTLKSYMQWCYASDAKGPLQVRAMWAQRIGGALLIVGWYFIFGSEPDKLKYNPIHPFIFWIPIAGWLMLRNSSKYLTELHSPLLEFMGRITLETYVLQFHVFMCKDVQYIPIVIPGSGKDGPTYLKVVNMLLCGAVFISLAVWVRHITVTTQEAVGDFFKTLKPPKDQGSNSKGTLSKGSIQQV